MILFPSESWIGLRRDLYALRKSGKLSEAEVFRQVLTVDHDDFPALLFLGLAAEKAGDQIERR